MKHLKLLLVVLTVLLLTFSFHPVQADDEINYDYDEIAANSEYDRIHKLDGVWYGVIYVENRNMFTVMQTTGYGALETRVYHHFLEFSFTRDTEYLHSIKIHYTVDKYCNGINIPILNKCIGTMSDPVENTKVYKYDMTTVGLGEAKNIDEAFGNGSIAISANPDFDYVVNLDFITMKDPDAHADILEFSYVLTDDEIALLDLEIQSQFEIERAQIILDPTLSIDEKKAAIEALITEYQDYVIDSGEVITSPCVGDNCSVDYDGNDIDIPELDGLALQITNTLRYVLFALFGAFGITLLIYISFSLTMDAVIEGTKFSIKTFFTQVKEIGDYYISVIKKILNFLLETFIAAFKK